MKNLKKVLALVLVLALAVSIGASAIQFKNTTNDKTGFADAESGTSTAIGVLVGMGIVEGDNNGKLNLTSTITRAEMAKILTVAILGADLTAQLPNPSVAEYTDVAKDAWYAKYISFLTAQNVLCGYGNGKFGPNDPVTGIQVIKMIVAALGYNANGELEGTKWEQVNYAKAYTLGILGSYGAKATSTACQRQYAFDFLFNAMDLNFVEYKATVQEYIPAVNYTQVYCGLTFAYGWMDGQYLAHQTWKLSAVKATTAAKVYSQTFTAVGDGTAIGVKASGQTAAIGSISTTAKASAITAKVEAYCTAEDLCEVGSWVDVYYNVSTGKIYYATKLSTLTKVTAADVIKLLNATGVKNDSAAALAAITGTGMNYYVNFKEDMNATALSAYFTYDSTNSTYKASSSSIPANREIYLQMVNGKIVAVQYWDYTLYSVAKTASVPSYWYGVRVNSIVYYSTTATPDVFYGSKDLPVTGLGTAKAKTTYPLSIGTKSVTLNTTEWYLAQSVATYNETGLGLIGLNAITIGNSYSFYYDPFTNEAIGIVPEYSTYGSLAFIAEAWAEITWTNVSDGYNTCNIVVKANLLFADGTNGTYTIAKIDGSDVWTKFNGVNFMGITIGDLLNNETLPAYESTLLSTLLQAQTEYGTWYVDLTNYVNEDRFALASTSGNTALIFTLTGKYADPIRDWKYETGSYVTSSWAGFQPFNEDRVAFDFNGGYGYILSTTSFAYYDKGNDNSASKYSVTYKTGKHASDVTGEKLHVFTRATGNNSEQEIVFLVAESAYNVPSVKTGDVYYLYQYDKKVVTAEGTYQYYTAVNINTGKVEQIAVNAKRHGNFTNGYYALSYDADASIPNAFIPAQQGTDYDSLKNTTWRYGKAYFKNVYTNGNALRVFGEYSGENYFGDKDYTLSSTVTILDPSNNVISLATFMSTYYPTTQDGSTASAYPIEFIMNNGKVCFIRVLSSTTEVVKNGMVPYFPF